MEKRIGKILVLVIYTALSLSNFCVAQDNIIYNGSFEELKACPRTEFDLPMAKGWQILRGTPDLFAACVPRGEPLGVPNNFNGTRGTFTGSAYAGISLIAFPNRFKSKYAYQMDEAIYTKLLKPLHSGARYRLSFLISSADSSYFCTDSLFCSFSKEPPVSITPVKGIMGKWNKFKNYDGFGCNINFPIKGSWNLVELEFIARNDYNYFSIGLPREYYTMKHYLHDLSNPLKSLSTSKWVEMDGYYYLDNFILIKTGDGLN